MLGEWKAFSCNIHLSVFQPQKLLKEDLALFKIISFSPKIHTLTAGTTSTGLQKFESYCKPGPPAPCCGPRATPLSSKTWRSQSSENEYWRWLTYIELGYECFIWHNRATGLELCYLTQKALRSTCLHRPWVVKWVWDLKTCKSPTTCQKRTSKKLKNRLAKPLALAPKKYKKKTKQQKTTCLQKHIVPFKKHQAFFARLRVPIPAAPRKRWGFSGITAAAAAYWYLGQYRLWNGLQYGLLFDFCLLK